MAARDVSTDPALEALRAFGLSYPGAHTKSPWPGHLDLAVNDKTFTYLSVAGDPFSISCKLPHTCDEALALPFATPTAYGLGKSGWVTAQLPEGPVPIELFKAWIDESYRAQAPKRLLAQLPADAAPSPVARPARARPASRQASKKVTQQAAVGAPRATRSTAAARKTPATPAAGRKLAKKRASRAS